jgi:hypothetical protein
MACDYVEADGLAAGVAALTWHAGLPVGIVGEATRSGLIGIVIDEGNRAEITKGFDVAFAQRLK